MRDMSTADFTQQHLLPAFSTTSKYRTTLSRYQYQHVRHGLAGKDSNAGFGDARICPSHFRVRSSSRSLLYPNVPRRLPATRAAAVHALVCPTIKPS